MCIKVLEKSLPLDIIKYNPCLSAYSTFGIGGRALAVLEPQTKHQLIKCIKVCRKFGFKFQVIGNGSNLLFPSRDTRRVFITTKKLKKQILLRKNSVDVGAGVFISEFVLWCQEKGFSGFENLFGIPATIGGMIMMNAGAFGVQISDRLIEIEVLSGNRIKTIKKQQIEFLHHWSSLLKSGDIVLSAKFDFERLAPSVIKSKIKEVAKTRVEKQPQERSAGSVFSHTSGGIPAGLLIDKAGLKGLKVGGALVSFKHANFIINQSNATDTDVKQLVKQITKKVKEIYNVNLKREIEYIGDRDEYYR